MSEIKKAPHGFPVVGIGASSGGISALKVFFAGVPADSGMAFVVIVHLSKDHESILAEILQTSAAIPVRQVTEAVKVEPDHVYVIPPAMNLAMNDGMILLTPRDKSMGNRVPIDLFFRTLASAYGKDAYAVVLSGSGSDGTIGIDRIKEAGGVTLTQDPEEAEYESMPRSAIDSGLIDVVLPVSELAAKVVAIFRSEPDEKNLPVDGPVSESQAQPLAEVLALVRVRTGHDFANYKRPTLLRRIARRQQVHGLEDMKSYMELLKEQPDEVQALMRDLLITVTNFFRDREAFAWLEENVIGSLFQGKGRDDTVRVWSCGCGTGEEAYSLAILLHEYAAKLEDPPKIQVFASDINESAIQSARACRYSVAIVADVTPERLKRYFTVVGDGYQVNKTLRETVLFAPHNVLRDPPFSQLDLIACRNLLIYLNRETQAKVMDLFGFALRPGGFLFLGSSEGMEAKDAIFTAVEKKFRIFSVIPPQRRRLAPMMPVIAKSEPPSQAADTSGRVSISSIAALHLRLAEHFAPPSVLINGNYETLHISERADRFLRFAVGEPTRDILRMVHPSLQLDLRAVLSNARKNNHLSEVRNIKLELDGEHRTINLSVHPVEVPDSKGKSFLVIFGDERQSIDASGKLVFESISGDEAVVAVVRQLEDELLQLKERLRVTLEEGEINVEELKAFNEELQAINEELRSATEEMETSKEELQSVNEELGTVNLELKDRMGEINSVNADLQNLMQSNEIGTIFLDRDLHIKRYTRRITRLFNIIETDVGRPFGHLTHRFDYRDLAEDAAAVLETLVPCEREIYLAQENSTYLARILPYRTVDDRIDGVVISFVDISELKQTAETLQERDFLLRIAQEAAMAGVWTLDLQRGGAWWTEECFKLHGHAPGSIEMNMHNWLHKIHTDPEMVKAAIQTAIREQSQYSHEFKIDFPEGERWILETGKASYDRAGEPRQMAGISLDITDRVKMRQEQSALLAHSEADERDLRQADRLKDEFLATLAHELRNPLAPIRIGVEVLKHSSLDSAEGLKVIGIIERQTGQMVRLIDDLLDVSRITSGKLRLQKAVTDLREAVSQAVEATQPMIDEADHQMEVILPENGVYVDGDSIRLIQVFSNLINNASKFTPSGGLIRIALVATEHEAQVTLTDNGEGIVPEELERIFDMFSQVERPSGQVSKGLGIGLTLVRSLVAKHDGTVEVRSEGAGLGCEFIVSLPRVAASARLKDGGENSGMNSAQPESRKILVVDDAPSTADILSLFFRLEGFSVRTDYDGESALVTCGEWQPDLVFLDIGMPGMGGHEVARKIRLLPTGVGTTLVALTGWGQEADRIKAQEAGFDHHLTKPVSPQMLRDFLAAHDSRD